MDLTARTQDGLTIRCYSVAGGSFTTVTVRDQHHLLVEPSFTHMSETTAYQRFAERVAYYGAEDARPVPVVTDRDVQCGCLRNPLGHGRAEHGPHA